MRGLLYIFLFLLLLAEGTVSSDKAIHENRCDSMSGDSIKSDKYIQFVNNVEYEIKVLSDSILKFSALPNYGVILDPSPFIVSVYRYRHIPYRRIVLDSLISKEVRANYDASTNDLIRSIPDTMTYIPGTVILANKYDCFCNSSKILTFDSFNDKLKDLFSTYYIDDNIIPCFEYKAINYPGNLLLRLAGDFSSITFIQRVDNNLEYSVVVKIDSLVVRIYTYMYLSLGEPLSTNIPNMDNENIAYPLIKGLYNTKGRVLNLDRAMEYVAVDGLLFKRVHTFEICK